MAFGGLHDKAREPVSERVDRRKTARSWTNPRLADWGRVTR